MLVRQLFHCAGATNTLNRRYQETPKHLLLWVLCISKMQAGYAPLSDARLIGAWECAVSACNS